MDDGARQIGSRRAAEISGPLFSSTFPDRSSNFCLPDGERGRHLSKIAPIPQKQGQEALSQGRGWRAAAFSSAVAGRVRGCYGCSPTILG